MSDRTDWLQHLKAGDTVIIERGYTYTNLEVTKVGKVTATQVVIGDMRFCRRTGWMRGRSGTSAPVCLCEATPAKLDKAFQQDTVSLMRTVKWDRLPIPVLRHVHEILEANKAQSP